MTALFSVCENCKGSGRYLETDQSGESVEYVCWACAETGEVPDAAGNQKLAAEELAHALALLCQWQSVENEQRLAGCLLVFARSLSSCRDPWEDSKIQLYVRTTEREGEL